MLLSLLDDSSDRLFIFFRFLNSSKHLHKQIQSFHSRVLNSQPHRRRRRHSSFTVIVYNSLKFNKTLQKNVRIDSLGINYYYGRTHNNQRDKILDVYPKTGNWPEMRRPRYIYIYLCFHGIGNDVRTRHIFNRFPIPPGRKMDCVNA